MESESCPICFTELNELNKEKTQCNHLFCKSCLLKLKHSQHCSHYCPLCRAIIGDDTVADSFMEDPKKDRYTVERLGYDYLDIAHKKNIVLYTPEPIIITNTNYTEHIIDYEKVGEINLLILGINTFTC